MRLCRLLQLFALTCLVLSPACSERRRSQKDPGIITVVPEMEATWVRHFNPLMISQARWPTLGGIYETLMVFNVVSGDYVPVLAERYEFSEDAKSITFFTRKKVRWSDGHPFSARDVAFTFNLLKQVPALDQHGAWSKLASVEATDEQAVVFRFKHPFVPGLYMLTQTGIVPEHLWKDIADPVKYANEDPVGTGPFTRVTSFQPQVFQVEKNPDYWQPGKPKIQGVRVPAYSGNDQRSLALIHGEVDWAGSFIPALDRIFVDKDPEHHGYFQPRVEGTVFLYTNTKRKPYDDVRVRKALSMAIDREKIVRVAMHGYTRPSDVTGLSDLYSKWRDPEVVALERWTDYNPGAAAQLLDNAGLRRNSEGVRLLPDGKPFTLEVNCVAGWSDWILAGMIAVRNFKALGIEASLETYAFPAYYERLQLGNYDLSMSWSSGDATPYGFYQRQMSTHSLKPLGTPTEHNWQRFADPETDRLLAAFERTSDPAAQRRLASAMQQRFVRTAPSIPLFPGPAWGQYNSTRFKGFPTQENPYAALSPFKIAGLPNYWLVLMELEPR